MRASYVPGDVARITATFDVDGIPAIPATVVARAMNPSGVISTYVFGGTVVAVATGAYQLDLPLDVPGKWWVRFEGTGSAAAAEEFALYVKQSEFT